MDGNNTEQTHRTPCHQIQVIHLMDSQSIKCKRKTMGALKATQPGLRLIIKISEKQIVSVLVILFHTWDCSTVKHRGEQVCLCDEYLWGRTPVNLTVHEKGKNFSCLPLGKKLEKSLLCWFILLSHEEPKQSSAKTQKKPWRIILPWPNVTHFLTQIIAIHPSSSQSTRY